MNEYVIAGDTAKYKDCLVYTCGKSKDWAEQVLNRMLTNPNENDLIVMKGLSNLRVEAVESKDQWWNDPFLAN